MAAYHRTQMTPEHEARLVKLLLLWSDGSITRRDITRRTQLRDPALRRLIAKYNIPAPNKNNS